MSYRVDVLVLIIIAATLLGGCQAEPVQEVEMGAPDAGESVPFSTGPTSPPSVKGPTGPPPGGSNDLPEAVTEVESVTITLPENGESQF